MDALDILFCAAGLLAALAVAAGCVMVLLVWIGGGTSGKDATEAWREADEA